MTNKLKDLEKTIEKDKFLWETIKRFDFYINSTNTKITIILAFNTFIITSVALKFNELLLGITNKNLHTAVAILLGAICLTSLLSVFFAFQVIAPFLKSKGNKNNYKSKIFFGDVSTSTIQSYIESISDLNYSNTVEDLTNQAHNLATGLSEKFILIQKSISWIFWSLIFSGLMLAIKVIDVII